MNMTDSKAITATVVAIAAAVIGLIVTVAPDWLNADTQKAIITLITVVTPVVVALIGVLHHNTAQVTKAQTYAMNGVKPAPRG